MEEEDSMCDGSKQAAQAFQMEGVTHLLGNLSERCDFTASLLVLGIG